jgi:phosphate transport system protein
MLRELLSILRSDEPLNAVGRDFTRMLTLTYELTVDAGEMFFGQSTTPEERTRIHKRDVAVNKLERSIRKQVIAHLSIRANTPNLPYCLLLMSLVKDVERIGDYAKNLAEVDDIHPEPLPEDDIVAELREIRTGVESMFGDTSQAFSTSDRETALTLTGQGRDLTHRCDALIDRIASSSYDARTASAMVLGARYYKRIAAHVLNVLSSVVMPLHKLDYYDEKEIPGAR